MSALKAKRKGSELPPLEKGKLRLYSMRLCPYAERTRLVLAHKKIPYETVNIHLKDKPDWFFDKNPLATVPVLEHDNKIVYESAVCNDYLDDIYPKEKLTPNDPYRHARDKILLEMYGKVTTPIYKLMRTKGEDQEAVVELHQALERFEKAITERGHYFGGDKIAMIDLLVWPHHERLGPLSKACGLDLLPTEKFPNLSAWITRMKQHPTVKEVLTDDDTHTAFFKSVMDGSPNYDIGL